jgi:hypothetical protein
MTTVEEIQRRQRMLDTLFRVFIALIILIVCVFIGWLVTYITYAEEIHRSFEQQTDLYRRVIERIV